MQWPENKIEKAIDKIEIKKRTKTLLSKVVPRVKSDNWRLNPIRYSSWNKLVCVFAYVMRFINNCRLKDKVRGPLNVDEVKDSEIAIIQKAQGDEFSDEIKRLSKGEILSTKSNISGLNPRMDADYLLKANGRLSLNEAISYDVRYPIILPRKHHVTKLIVKMYHELGNHVIGTNHTLSLLSEKYWVQAAREEIRECEKNCMGCRRRLAKQGEQIMAPLPKNRTRNESLKAFTRVAVDYAGPFLTKQGRRKVQTKRYLCLFTCLSSRAVHLEMAYGLDTDTFLNAFHRFVSRRGKPEEIMSDNGRNFVGADRELKGVLKSLDKDKIQSVTVVTGIKWSFILPMTPHFGGVHESLIKSANRAIYGVLRNADITDEELHSAFVGAEGILNSRPLTYQSASVKDIIPLTPNHFLHGQMGGNLAPESILDTTVVNPRKRWRRVQELMRHFWNRWLREWLPALNQRKKWREPKRDLRLMKWY
ncbi:uncharacterized protein [Antedon mediterranea]|uniref:uncharacterized protein n=1 Tax=Antedon mediterranea TaxID=105859 RepID=UPI003AF83DEA